MTDNTPSIPDFAGYLKEKLKGIKEPITKMLFEADLKRYNLTLVSWTMLKYKNSFLGEFDYFIKTLFFDSYLEMETVYQSEDKIYPGQALSINDKELVKFLMERGGDEIDLYQKRFDVIYNETLETLLFIDNKCEEFREWKKQTFNKETTDKELKEFVYPVSQCLIAYTKRHRKITETLELLGNELKKTPTEIEVAYIRLQIPGLGNLKADDFKDLAKIEPVRKISARVEGNLIEYPIAVLNKQGTGSFVEGNFVVLKDDKGNTLSKIGTPYGVLTAFDLNTLVIMMSFMTEVNNKYILAFSDYALLKRLGISEKGGGNYMLLENSKKKIGSMTVSISRFIKGKKENITGIENYPIFSGSYMPTGETAKKQNSKNPLHFNYFLINPLIAENFALKYFNWIDIKTWNSLPTPTAKRLYEYLTKRKNIKGGYYQEKLKSLCAKIPLETKNITKSKSILKRDLETLKKENIIAEYCFTKDNKIVIHFYKGKPKPGLLAGKIEGKGAKVFTDLIKNGVEQDIALSLIRDYSLDIIRRQIEWLSDRNIQENKAGMLVTAIKENWSMPKGAEDRYIERQMTGTARQEAEPQGDKEGLEAISKLTETIGKQGAETTSFMEYISPVTQKPQRLKVTLESIEGKFIEARNFPDYWQVAESIITRYSKDLPDQALRDLANKHKP